MLTAPEFQEDIRPIFIIGAPRSGTSVMTWALGQHPNIQTMEETNWMATLAVGGWLSLGLGSGRGTHTHLSSSGYPAEAFMRRLGEFAHRVVNDCFEERCRIHYGDFRSHASPAAFLTEMPMLALRSGASDPKRRWVDGTPLNTHFTWGLAQMFPKAVFIHNLRRPADVATSLEGFDSLGAEAFALGQGLDLWAQHVETAALAERAFGAERVFRLRFERISEDGPQLLRDLFDFLGEEYCARSAATLTQRLNSSEVSDRRQVNAEAMLEMPQFLRASSLYWQLQNHRPPDAPSGEASELLRARFVKYCDERTLL